MACPECKRKGLDSTVRLAGFECEGEVGEQFRDGVGNLHVHNGSTSTSRYNCSRGHRWTEIIKFRCWCGWPKPKESEHVEAKQEKGEA